jgi:hypothetical protein
MSVKYFDSLAQLDRAYFYECIHYQKIKYKDRKITCIINALDGNRIISTCPSVTKSHFFTFSLQYVNTFKFAKTEYFQKIYKLAGSTHHKSSVKYRPSFTTLKVKYVLMTESPKMVMSFQCCVNNRKV